MKDRPHAPLSQVLDTVHRLRAPGGCPWDREQTHQSLRPYVIEEAYEVLDVLDQVDTPEALQNPTTRDQLKEELGDLLMQVLIHSEMASESGAFDFADVAQALNDKLIRRHPHVFGNTQAKDSAGALQNWEKQKAQEKAKSGIKSILDGLPRGLPALQRSARLLEKVARVGFQWPDLEGPLAKIDEELEELKSEIKSGDPERIGEELGDVLFTLCNLAFVLKVSPEDTLRGTLGRFERRFRYVEKKLQDLGKSPDQSTLQEMDEFWNEAKRSGL